MRYFISSIFLVCILMFYCINKTQDKTGLKNEVSTDKTKIPKANFEIFLQAFKEEAIIELWIKSMQDSVFQKAKTYDICYSSGRLGPKRKQGDHQVPEGIYHIDRFNPKSNYHLSLGINYPNKSDLIRGHQTKPGGDIFIHGNCVSIGCLPILDEPIEELYNIASNAKSNGQDQIPVWIFPFRMEEENVKGYGLEFIEHDSFWNEISLFYQYFKNDQLPPTFEIDEKGRYVLP